MEEVISAHPAVAQVAVFGVEDPFWGEAVTAAVVKREGMALTNDELLTFCRECLAGYKRPKKYIFWMTCLRTYMARFCAEICENGLKDHKLSFTTCITYRVG